MIDVGFTTIRLKREQRDKLRAVKLFEKVDTMEEAVDRLLGDWKEKNSKKKRSFDFLGW